MTLRLLRFMSVVAWLTSLAARVSATYSLAERIKHIAFNARIRERWIEYPSTNLANRTKT